MGQAAGFKREGMPMFDELAALSSPEGLWLNAVGLICFVAFALGAMSSLGSGTRLKRRRFIIVQPSSGYRIGCAAALGG